MTYSAIGYAKRAAECARLANLTKDQMVQQELLRFRQTCLRLAETLGMPLHDAIEFRPDDASNGTPAGQG